MSLTKAVEQAEVDIAMNRAIADDDDECTSYVEESLFKLTTSLAEEIDKLKDDREHMKKQIAILQKRCVGLS